MMPRNRTKRHFRTQFALALCSVLALAACSARYAQAPPRVDLAPYGRVALITFSADQSSAAMSALATQRFAEALLASQSGIELLELGSADSSLRALGPNPDATALAQALGRQREVPAVFLGTLTVSGAKPQGHLSTSGMNVRTTVSAELTVRLISTRSGGTVWRSSAAAEGTVGQFTVANRLPTIAIRDQQEAYGEVVDRLVADLTRDFRPTRVRQ
jgi:hypothetical protein